MADNTSVFNLLQNYNAAQSALSMTPQEQALYKRHLDNLWGSGGVDNPDGSRSSLYQMSTPGPDGQIYNIPTIYNGQKLLAPGQALGRAEAQGLGNFPAYPSFDAAESRYDQMHQFMDKDTAAYTDVRRGPLSLFGSMIQPFTNR